MTFPKKDILLFYNSDFLFVAKNFKFVLFDLSPKMGLLAIIFFHELYKPIQGQDRGV